MFMAAWLQKRMLANAYSMQCWAILKTHVVVRFAHVLPPVMNVWPPLQLKLIDSAYRMQCGIGDTCELYRAPGVAM